MDLGSGKTQDFLCVALEPLPKHTCSHHLHLKESFMLISFFMVDSSTLEVTSPFSNYSNFAFFLFTKKLAINSMKY
jgi:hypothetical protein